MKFNKWFLLVVVFFSSHVQAKNYLDENLRRLNWNGIDVVWLEDNSLPTYDVSIYFADGALGDQKGYAGLTELMFDQLSLGTNRYSQKEIVESLEYYGARYSSRVIHEYSTFSVSGLIKDIVPTMKMVCHMFSDSIFPKKELKKVKKRMMSEIQSVVSNHSQLAHIVFRKESLKGSGFEYPTGGTIQSIKKISSTDMTKRLTHFNKNVLKRVYIKGPSAIQKIQNIFEKDCGWKKASFEVKIPVVKKAPKGSEILFVSVPKANQAQVRIGRLIKTAEIDGGKADLKTFASNYLGVGFTSQLFRKLRLEKGLTYSVSSYVSEQKNYGRSGISTFTKNETILDLLDSTKRVIEKASVEISKQDFELSQKKILGNYLLSLESTSEFLNNLLYFDHIKRDYAEIYHFSKNMKNYNSDQLKKMIAEIFSWEKQSILILGNKNLIPKLKKAGYKVKSLNYKSYL